MKTKHFVTPAGRLDKIRMRFDVVDEPGLMFLQSEIVVFLDQFDDFTKSCVKGAVCQAIFVGQKRFL